MIYNKRNITADTFKRVVKDANLDKMIKLLRG